MTTLLHSKSAVRFRRGWNGRSAGAIATASELTYGQRDTLVMRGVAEWVEAEQPPKWRKKTKESAE